MDYDAKFYLSQLSLISIIKLSRYNTDLLQLKKRDFYLPLGFIVESSLSVLSAPKLTGIQLVMRWFVFYTLLILLRKQVNKI